MQTDSFHSVHHRWWRRWNWNDWEHAIDSGILWRLH